MSAAKRRRVLAGSLVMAAALVAGAAGVADAQWIYINSVTPASSGASAAVSIEFYSRWAAQEVCEPDGWCYPMTTYEGYADPGSFTATVNGANRTSAFSVSLAEASVCDYYGLNDYDCYDRYAASASAMPTTAGASNTLTASVAVSNYGTPSASSTFSTPAPPAAPFIDLLPHNGANRDVSKCAFNCFEAVLSYTTPSYTSMDVARAVTLVYHSRRVMPYRVVQLNAVPTMSNGNVPLTLSLRLRRGDGSWVTFNNGTQEIYFTTEQSTDTMRLIGRFDDAPYGTPSVQIYTAVVTSTFSDGSRAESSAPIQILSAVQAGGPYGFGWSLAGLEKVTYQGGGGLLLTAADGTIRFYAPCPTGCDTFVSPAGDVSTLVHLPSGPNGVYFERRFIDESALAYDWHGRLVQARDRFGNATIYRYVGNTLAVDQITDPAGKVTTLSYNGSGYLTTVTDPGGRVSTITINAEGDLAQIVRPDSLTALTVGYSWHVPLWYTDANGERWDIGWDGVQRLAGVTSPEVEVDGVRQRPTTTYRSLEADAYSALHGGRGTATNPGARLNPAGLRAIVISPRGYGTSYALNRFGQPTKIEEPRGRTTSVTYDTLGRTTRVQSPSGHDVTVTYAHGTDLPRVITDSTAGTSQGYTYATNSAGVYAYLTRTAGTMADSAWYDWSTTGVRRLVGVKVGRSTEPWTQIVSDSRGRDSLVTDGRGHTTATIYETGTYSFNNTQRVTSRAAGVSGERLLASATYDQFGRRLQTINASGHTVTPTYDVLNRITRTITHAGDTTLFWNNAYVDSLRDPAGQTYRAFRNALGWVTHRVDPSGRADSIGYDRDGNVTWTRNRRQQVTTFTYDALGYLTSRTADGQTTGYATDSHDRWTATWNAESRDTIHFDVRGLPTNEVSVINGMRFVRTSGYDAAGRRTSLQVSTPGGTQTVGYRYNARGQLDTLIDMSGRRTSLAYDDDGLPTSIRMPWAGGGSANGVGTSYSSLHRPQMMQYSSSTMGLGEISWALGYDNASRLTTRVNGDGTRSREYMYDTRGRMQAATDYLHSGGSCAFSGENDLLHSTDEQIGLECGAATRSVDWSWTYSYDRVGNPNRAGDSVSANRLVRYDSATYYYDADGNDTLRVRTSTGAPERRLRWNTLGQLTSAWSSWEANWSYGYDGWGRRVRFTNSGTGDYSYFLYDGDQLVAELFGSGVPYASYANYPGVDQPHSLQHGGRTYYVTRDGEGSVSGLVDTAGVLVNSYHYLPNGHVRFMGEAVPQRVRFKGREYHGEIGLVYMRARWYDPGTGRFVSEDPIGLAGGINPYAFAGNDPVNYSDPFGLQPTPAKCKLGECPPILTPVTIWADDRYGEYEFVPGKGGRGPTGIAFGGGPDGGPGGGRTSTQPTGEEKAKAIAKEVLACTLDNYGLTAAGLSLAAAGANVIGTRGKFAGATPGTSLASMAARSMFGDREFSGGRRLWSLTGFPGVGRGVRIMATSSVGAFAGRAVPVVGYALLAYDAYKITRCVVSDD